jgi:hypothetical protein
VPGLLRPLTLCSVLGFAIALTGSEAHAQSTAVVRQTAPIYLYPDSSRIPLRTASVGTTLRVLKEQGDWLNVEFHDPQFGPRIGWVRRALVAENTAETTPMDLSVLPPPPLAPAVVTDADPESAGPVRPRLDSAPLRRGFWFNAGVGIGSLGCEDCIQRTDGLSGGLSLGGTIGSRVLLGVGTSGWSKDVDGDLLTVGTLDARVRVYPARRTGFFLTGGLGLGTLSYGEDDAEIGLGLILGLGWDIRVGRNVSLTPFWNGFAMANDLVDANVGQIGIGVTIH